VAEEESGMCPNCGTRAKPGEVICSHCGTNMETGEHWEARVKRAKGSKTHDESFARGVMFLPVLAFAALVFMGFMYQRSAETALSENSSEVQTYVKKMEKADRLAAFGQEQEAKKLLEDLAETLKEEASSIDVGKAYSPGDEKEEGEREKMARRKSLLVNLQKKAEHKLDHF